MNLSHLTIKPAPEPRQADIDTFTLWLMSEDVKPVAGRQESGRCWMGSHVHYSRTVPREGPQSAQTRGPIAGPRRAAHVA
jgi:hypothetical protein